MIRIKQNKTFLQKKKKKQRFQSEKKRKNNRGTKLKRTYVARSCEILKSGDGEE
jgi:hypothetical protein